MPHNQTRTGRLPGKEKKMSEPVPIACTDLRALIAVENDPARREQLQAEYDQRCGGGATDSGGGGTGNPPRPPQQN